MKQLFVEVYNDLNLKFGKEFADKIDAMYDSLENSIKINNISLFDSPNLDNFNFPFSSKELLEQMNFLLEVLKGTRNEEAIGKCEDLIRELKTKIVEEKPAEAKAEKVKADCAYKKIYPMECKKDTLINKQPDRPMSEPNKRLTKAVSDFIYMNAFDAEIVEDIDALIKVYAGKITNNEAKKGVLIGIGYDEACFLNNKIKLAAYYNLNTNNAYNITMPEMLTKNNKAILEISLYNGFLSSIVKVAMYWKQKIFGLIDKSILESQAQYDLIYKSVSKIVSKVMNKKMNEFMQEMGGINTLTNNTNRVDLSDSELLALEELFVTRLRKPIPRKYAYEWESRL